MSRDPHQVGPRTDVVDDPLDGHDRAAAGPERPPDPFEQRRVQRHVAGPVGDRRVHQRDVGLQRREEPDLAEGRVDAGVRLVRSIDEPAIERVTIAGRPRAPASSRCANARNDQCSTADLAALVCAREPGFGVKFGNVSPE